MTSEIAKGRREGGQRRKPSGDRIAEIIDRAEHQLLETGALPLSIHAISKEMGSSRALVYAYFSDQRELVDAVVDRAIERLRAEGLDAAISAGSGSERLLAACDIYLAHIVRWGPVLHYVMRHNPRTARLSPAARRTRAGILRLLGGAMRSELDLSAAETMALIEMLVAIPEELARLVRRGELDLSDARATCRRLLLAGMESLRPVASATVPHLSAGLPLPLDPLAPTSAAAPGRGRST